MEYFHKAKSVRLRSHHKSFLLAEDDEKTVSQHRDGSHRNARWKVEFIEDKISHKPLIRLKSCYNRYLTATEEPFLLGMTGKKVQQTQPSILDPSVEWEPIKDGHHVLLKTHKGTYLRANGFSKPWKNKVTHNIPRRTVTQYWVFWEIEVTEIAISTPELGLSSPKKDGRLIYYAMGDENGNMRDGSNWASFSFKANDVQGLIKRIAEESGVDDIILYAKNPSTEKLYPLRLQLPPNNSTLHLVVVSASSHLGRSFT